MASAIVRRLLLGLLAGTTAFSHAKKQWIIEDNVFNSYFNLDGDVTDELPKGTILRMNNANYKIIISMSSGPHTFIQLDKDHGAEVGDFFKVVEEGDPEYALSTDDMGGSEEDAELETAVKSAAGSGGTSLDDSEDDEEEEAPKQEEVELEDVKPKPGEFSEDIPFSDSVDVDDVTAEVKAQGKPGLVFVTQPWCGACKNLKTQVSQTDSVKKMLSKFVVVHAAEDAGAQWQADGEDEGYIPRVYFMAKTGKMLDVRGPSEDHARFFGNARALEKAMKSVLAEKPHAASDEL
eukprot:TRINITY_DN50355_c0_g1_i1.p1 TRINITY_DN50355_c0_g1~~TRINITY_DN50355_c0_g1_i1.p1  ORF type:complete len:310 (-),score=93.31 TRINITY_DN50355_c0_g1_i1:192-1067(-)